MLQQLLYGGWQLEHTTHGSVSNSHTPYLCVGAYIIVNWYNIWLKHYLPVVYQIKFKLATVTYRTLSTQQMTYC